MMRFVAEERSGCGLVHRNIVHVVRVGDRGRRRAAAVPPVRPQPLIVSQVREVAHDVIVSGVTTGLAVVCRADLLVQLVEPKKRHDIGVLIFLKIFEI